MWTPRRKFWTVFLSFWVFLIVCFSGFIAMKNPIFAGFFYHWISVRNLEYRIRMSKMWRAVPIHI